jgi:polyhydroxyalkanoate synthesis regulator phasin
MAIKLPGFKFLSAGDAKSRVFLLFVVVIGVIVAIFFAVQFFGGGGNTTGASRVAAPPSLANIPGAKETTPEYNRALLQANAQIAQQAQMTGTSAIPTLMNQQSSFPQQNCTVLCPSPDNVDVANDINELVKGGKLPQKDANLLLAMAKNNVPVDEYAAELDRLVKEGKLTPEQARKLLEQYKKQHQNALTNELAKPMDALIKAGQLPLDTANSLLALQKSGVTSADYADELNRLVKEGKISQPVAAQLLGQYTQQQAREATKQGLFELKKLAKSGAITPDVANQLSDMISKNVPVDEYAAALQRLVAQGKITPAEAARLLAEYKARRQGGGATSALDALIQQQEIECQNDLKKAGASASKTPPPSCQKLNDLKAQAQRLAALRANNATPAAYADELKRAVQAGLITPDNAAALMQDYQASLTPLTNAPEIQTNLPTTADFAKLQQTVQSQPLTQTVAPQATTEQFAAAAAQVDQQALQERAQRIQQLQAAMSSQAQSLIAAWQTPKMAHVAGTPPSTSEGKLLPGEKGAQGGSITQSTTTTTITERPLIKSGTIMFAVLDTAVDSDYPDTPVMATIVQGPMKGARLLGKLALAQGQDRVSLSFNLMDMDVWPKTKTVSAFAIDPDTARTVMASNVNHHYMMRYGSLFASSFMTGFASGIQNAGTSTTGIFGTSSTHPQLSFGSNMAVALGQVGTAFTDVVKGYVNTPATVRINSGVGLGILFMSDVT